MSITRPTLPTLAAGMLLAACSGLPPSPASRAAPAAPPAAAAACPAGVVPGSRCLFGRDAAGAYYGFAIPPHWDGRLVVHAHGGPALGAPKAERVHEDMARWSVFTRMGWAWAASGFHQGGVAVRSAAEDTERVRQLFIAQVGAPRFTLLHGQSWGASVAARASDLYGAPAHGKPPYDAVLLTSGVLGGGSLSYDFRLDLRVVYQVVCGNHPKADEPAYPLWQGLPPGSPLTRAELAARIDDCTGVRKPPAQRSAQQQRKLDTILAVVRIPERSLIAHLNWATWHFQDIAFNRVGGRNVFDNARVLYRGSADDTALNAQVLRYHADAQAAAAFAADTDPQGRFVVPVMTVHAIDDPTAFVELESTFRDTVARAGHLDKLVQTFTADHEHSYLSDVQYVAATEALVAWAQRGEKPTAQAVATRCHALDARWGTGCRYRPDYTPPPLAQRVPPR
ncbi:MAG: hypothetical protein IT390_19355 [Nitrospira sp.]|nr:hypothetical protein [Nitrospira sp.]